MVLFQCCLCLKHALYNECLLSVLRICADCAEDIPSLKVERIDNEECEKKEALGTR